MAAYNMNMPAPVFDGLATQPTVDGQASRTPIGVRRGGDCARACYGMPAEQAPQPALRPTGKPVSQAKIRPGYSNKSPYGTLSISLTGAPRTPLLVTANTSSPMKMPRVNDDQ